MRSLTPRTDGSGFLHAEAITKKSRWAPQAFLTTAPCGKQGRMEKNSPVRQFGGQRASQGTILTTTTKNERRGRQAKRKSKTKTKQNKTKKEEKRQAERYNKFKTTFYTSEKSSIPVHTLDIFWNIYSRYRSMYTTSCCRV